MSVRDGKELPEQDAAGELARLWEDAPLTAVLLQLPGQPMSLGFAGPQLASRSREEIASLTSSALAAGHSSQVLAEQVKAVAVRLSADFAGDGANGILPAQAGTGATAWFGVSTHHLMLAAGSGAIVVLLALLLLARRCRRNRPRLFPLTAARDRFSAPHSGGNNAMIPFLDENKRG